MSPFHDSHSSQMGEGGDAEFQSDVRTVVQRQHASPGAGGCHDQELPSQRFTEQEQGTTQALHAISTVPSEDGPMAASSPLFVYDYDPLLHLASVAGTQSQERNTLMSPLTDWTGELNAGLSNLQSMTQVAPASITELTTIQDSEVVALGHGNVVSMTDNSDSWINLLLGQNDDFAVG